MSTSLKEFKELVMSIEEIDMLNIAEDLLKDIIKIQDMKERIQTLEESLSEGERAAFWFFAMGLDRDEIDMATNVVIGRRRVVETKDKRFKEERDSSSKSDSSEGDIFQI